MPAKPVRVVCTALAMLLGTACLDAAKVEDARESRGAPPGHQDAAVDRELPIDAIRAPLVYPGGDTKAPPDGFACTEWTVDACAWASSVDALFLGEVLAIHPVSDPVVNMSGSACEVIEPAMKVVFQVQEVFAGELEVGQTFELHLGRERMNLMSPMPSWEGEQIQWLGTKEPPLALGRRMVVGSHHVESADLWSLLGEPWLWVGEDGRIEMQGLFLDHECPEPIPQDLVGRDEGELHSLFDACPEENEIADMRRTSMQHVWGDPDRPTYIMAAACFGKTTP